MRIGIVTIGCDKNVVDNEYLGGLLAERGHDVERADPDSPPDVVVITTCGFLDVARKQSLDEMRRWTELRNGRARPRVAVIGCLAQRVGEKLREEVPGIDFIAGVAQFERVLRMIEGHDCPAGGFVIEQPKVEITRSLPRRRLESVPYSYLKISDGCNHSCSFCSIPLMKGRHRSVPRAILLEEARQLVAQGVKEINLVAQDTAVYGTDTEGRPALPDLLEDLCAIPGEFWIRVFYLYPTSVSDRLIQVVADQPKIVKYLDVPLQHFDEEVLRAMRRPHDGKRTRQLLLRLRERIPGLVLRTTFIVGFPGETERTFRNLLEGVREIGFERMGAFRFSPEPGTPSATLENQVEIKTATKRFDRLMRLQAEISAAWSARQVGTRRRVLVEGHNAEADVWFGRSYSEAPEIDGFIAFNATEKPRPGEFIDVDITEADVYDLGGERVEPNSLRK